MENSKKALSALYAIHAKEEFQKEVVKGETPLCSEAAPQVTVRIDEKPVELRIAILKELVGKRLG